ncbi:uncharacterized protein N7446_007916 [Penicillium canescens]|uniref:Uncharacterized protein n=1 Tax=Penicillium canescens TaxID=5083 RepID=A0AAD6IMC4_PENCN|nr:uncharacterized protein N7446_007867 [Penicillium canescens]XP_058370307.1 uncharacterized protein N7446_007916 [Penicillium canescens]KAJ6033792.1 hypothetical protein N7444_011563 [Penicillium canescens]KAJ6033841.1 hypothetical protein N7444_011612 [Penicillium canescens]KAJ6056970.1 hypothetical protein N7460_000244 [Penicillium canescens]KAJ6057016.1 hypothetical protein N7460_000290 [Penicillium canescens]KAJ6058284.1 hypothetical protein N7446_007867 [Penicillium canescens]
MSQSKNHIIGQWELQPVTTQTWNGDIRQKLFEAFIESRNNDERTVGLLHANRELGMTVRALKDDLFVLKRNLQNLKRENLGLKKKYGDPSRRVSN